MRMINPPLVLAKLKIFSFIFSRVGVSCSPPYITIVDHSRLKKSGSGSAYETGLKGTEMPPAPSTYVRPLVRLMSGPRGR
jgi:hypothetical protein